MMRFILLCLRSAPFWRERNKVAATRLSNVERESIWTFNEAERTASIYTHNPALKTQLQELCRIYPDQVRQTAANAWGGLTFELPKKWLRVKPPRVLSPAQRAVLDKMNQTKRDNV